MSKTVDPKARTIVSLPTPGPGPLQKSAFILVLAGTRFGEVYKLHPGRVLRVGRGEEVDIRLDDEGISRVHCSLEARGQQIVLRDLGSQNGTYVAGERVEERVLGNGDRVQVGVATTFKIAWADEVEVKYQRRLAEIALRDPLTGIYNRRHFGERVAAEVAAARRYRRPVSVVMLDIDGLARVNETYDRGAGDEVLRSVARVLEGLVRGGDVVARLGGDEFGLLLRETDLSGAQALGERLRETIEQLRTQAGRQEIAVTATVGFAVDVPESREGSEARDLMSGAERALERVKELGTNRVGN
jgi:two-component system cell cycle response regulator